MKTHPRLTSYFDGAIDDLAVELGAAIQAQIRDAGDIGIGTVRLRLADALSVLRGDFIAGRPIDDDAPSSPPEPEYVITTRNYENVTTTGDPLAPVPVRYLVAFCPLWDDNAEQAARSLELYISARWALDSIAVYPADVLDVPAAPATPAEEAIDAIATRRARLEHLLDAPFTFGAEEELREAIRAATSELADAVDRYVAVIQNGAGE